MSGPNSIHEQAHKKQRTDSTWRCLHPSSGGSRDEEQGDCPSDTKRKGSRTREYPKPVFDLRRLVGPKGRTVHEKRQKTRELRVPPSRPCRRPISRKPWDGHGVHYSSESPQDLGIAGGRAQEVAAWRNEIPQIGLYPPPRREYTPPPA